MALAVAENGTSVTVAHSQIVVSRGSQLCSTLPVKFEPTSITWHSSNGKYAVGGKVSLDSVTIVCALCTVLCINM